MSDQADLMAQLGIDDDYHGLSDTRQEPDVRRTIINLIESSSGKEIKLERLEEKDGYERYIVYIQKPKFLRMSDSSMRHFFSNEYGQRCLERLSSIIVATPGQVSELWLNKEFATIATTEQLKESCSMIQDLQIHFMDILREEDFL